VSSANGFADDARHQPLTAPDNLVRDLARQGLLAERFATAAPADQAMLRAGAYAIAWPVVFNKLTRPIERRRGHHDCAASVLNLEAECLDRFQDDVESVLDDLFRHAKVPIHNLEGWLVRRLMAATVDGYRRRRGDRGALQRPRLPQWLADALGHDPWLTSLALEMLTWVGVPVSAGTGIWPLTAWAEYRAALTGDHHAGEADVAREVETVLAAMRRRRTWHEKFVERPLGRKQAPLLPVHGTDPDEDREQPHLALTPRHEADDARLTQLAAVAVEAIEVRLRQGENPRQAVEAVLRTVFSATIGVPDLDLAPMTDRADDEHVVALLADRRSLDRLVARVLTILDVR
jgi:hypothetical protein